MKTNRLICMLFACVSMLCLSITPAGADSIHREYIIWTEDMEYDLIDLSAITRNENTLLPLTTDSINTTVSPFSTKVIRQVSLQRGNVIIFNCSCSPLSASMDFGVIDTSGRFYNINIKEGSINQALGISQAGTYQVAIRNNSSQTVRVVGFVDY